MTAIWDEAIREDILAGTGLDVSGVDQFFAGVRLESPAVDDPVVQRRIVSIGFLAGRMVVLAWEARGGDRRILGMRLANEREQTRFGERLGAVGRP